ncbi:MAG: DNA repair protein RecN [Cytophagales bacterium]|nr:DNA repair protein RecN [Cytophagales bacterium]
MLSHLLIRNYALIQHLEINPSQKLNIITGETGAGKSIVLGALGLLLGKRADLKSLYDSSQKCVIEGTFDISAYRLQAFFDEHELDYADQTLVRREISPAGKSRAFVNDTPVNLETMRQLGGFLIDIHSQHDTMQLGSNLYQLELIDAFAENHSLRDQYQSAYFFYRKKKKAYEGLVKQAAALRKEADYNQFLYDELAKANLSEGEKERLEEELKVLENAEEIKSKLSLAGQLLSNPEQSVNDALHTVGTALSGLARLSSEYSEISERLQSCLIELRDLADEIDSKESLVEYNPQKTEECGERLSRIYQLEQKHQVGTVKELLQIQEELEQKVNQVMGLDDELDTAKREAQQAHVSLMEVAEKLSQTRSAVFDLFAQEIQALLADLGMENARLQIDLETIEPADTGIDEVRLMFSANKGMPLQELKAVASGGEFARLMFAVKYILADKTALPTIVFDEIDTGISGEIALKMVQMMERMSRKHQLVVITHLPQIASKGERHYFVYKDHSADRTVSKMRPLSSRERVEELAKMIGGDLPAPSAYESAKDLLGV